MDALFLPQGLISHQGRLQGDAFAAQLSNAHFQRHGRVVQGLKAFASQIWLGNPSGKWSLRAWKIIHFLWWILQQTMFDIV